MSPHDRDIGSLEAQVKALQEDMTEIKADVREVRDALVQIRGGRRVLWALMPAMATAGAALDRIVEFVWGKG